MPKPIDHNVRKRQIVAESVKLFARYGFSDVNFALIAKESGVSRTLLYTYFKDKRAIFNAAIDEVTSLVRAKYEEILPLDITADAKLRKLCLTVLTMMYGQRDFVCAIADVLTDYRRQGINPKDKVAAHTNGLRLMIAEILTAAFDRGEYDARFTPVQVTERLYSQFEATALRIAVTGKGDLAESVDEVDSLLLALRPRS